MSAQDALDHDALLSDATLLALQLHRQPFTTEPKGSDRDSDDVADATLFSDAITDEQLADIKQALITGDDLLLILGENGSRKTTLLKQLEANSGLRIQCFPVTGNERFSTLNLFTGMLQAFKIKPPATLKGVLDELIPSLQTMVGRNTLGVVLLDDAHKASAAELTQLLSGMLYMNSQDETLIRVALSANGEFEDLIPDLLPEGADLPYSSLTIEGFSPQRAAAYLDYRLQLAGFDQDFPFTDRDMASLVDHSAGLPAELHTLTADILNEKYGAVASVAAHELETSPNEGFLQSRAGKLLLGAVATVLILGGALMFMPSPEQVNPPPIREPVELATQSITPQPPEPLDPTAVPAPPQPVTAPTVPEPAVVNPTASNAENSAADASAQPNTATGTSGSASALASDNNVSSVAQEPSAPSTESANQNGASEQPSTADSSIASDAENTGSEPVTDSIVAQNTPAPATQNTEASDSTETSAQTEQATQIAAIDSATEAPEPLEDQTADTETVTEPDNAAADLTNLPDGLESPSWILVQDESLFTIQMSASTDLPSVQNFLRRNPLPPPNSIFSFERDGVIWYALVHGIFPSVADARRTVELMSAQAQRDQPWIRSIARIKSILRDQ